jgi:hypothetical protein
VADLDPKYREQLEAQAGEQLRGLCIASQQKGMFKGGSAVIGVTEAHLLIQALDRRGNPDGAPRSIAPEQVAAAKAGPAGGGWFTVDAVVLDHAAVRLEIRTTDGEKHKLMLMRGEGGLLGKLGGGETQQHGVQALGRWFEAIQT